MQGCERVQKENKLTKVSPNNAVPCWLKFLVEVFLNSGSDVLLYGVKFHGLTKPMVSLSGIDTVDNK